MKVLVLGGTGTVGSQVVRELQQRKAEVSVLTRGDKGGSGKPLPQGVKAVIGDLKDVGTVRSVFRGFDGVFLLNVVSPTEAQEGLFAVNGARLGGVKRLVYMSVFDADKAAHLPHFGAKVPVEMAVRESGIEATILRPNNFYQNDLWFKDAMLQYGVYPQPLGDVGVSRVDVRDIAEAAAIALTEGGHGGRTYNLVGPVPETGASVAKLWTDALGREVRYGGHADMDAWEKQQVGYGIPDYMAFDFRMMYEHFQKKGLKGTPGDVETLTRLLGHAPRAASAFTRETAEAWKATAGKG
jgi:uncharacterized protein YbjT (DUF2867 family)